MSKTPPPKKRSLLRLFGRIVATLLVLLALLIGVAFLLRDRIGAELRNRLDTQLAQRGLHVDYRASDFAPFRGLTLSEVKVYRDSSRQTTAVTLSEAHLRYRLLGILTGRSAASIQLITDQAELVLSDETKDFAIRDLSTRVSIDPLGTEIQEFSGNFRDVRFQIDGELAWETSNEKTAPDKSVEKEPSAEVSQRVIDLSPILRWLDQVPDTPEGEVDLRFTLSRPGYPAPYSLSGQVEGVKLSWQGLIAENALLRFSVDPSENGAVAITFPELNLEIAGGSLEAAGSWNSATNQLSLTSFHSSLNPAVLAPVIPEKSSVTLPSLPPYELTGSGTLPLSDVLAGQFSGTISCDGPAEIPLNDRVPLIVSSMNSEFALKDRSVALANLALKLGDGGPATLHSQATVHFPTAPETGLKVDFQALELTHDGQTLTASGSVDPAGQTLVLDSLQSTVHPAALLVALGFDDPLSSRVRFPDGPPRLVVSGSLALDSVVPDSKLTGSLTVPQTAEIPAGNDRTARLTDLSTGFTLEGGRLSLTKLVTGAFEGNVSAPAITVDLTASPVTFDGTLGLDALDLEAITTFFGTDKRRTGKLSGRYQGAGSPDLATLTGSGEIEIAEAEFSTMPIFRTLRPLLSAITLNNWRGETEGANLSSAFTFEEGVMNSDDIALVGDFYEVHAQARVDFPNRELAADGYVSTSGATKVLTQVVGKVLKIEAAGNFDDFSWKLKNVPGLGTVSDLTGLSKDLLGKTLGAATDGEIAGALLDGVKGTLSNGAKPIRGAADLAEDTLKGVTGAGKKLLNFGRNKDKTETEEPPNQEEVPESRD